MKVNSDYELTFINFISDQEQKVKVSQQLLSMVIELHIVWAYLIQVSFDLRIKSVQTFESKTDNLHYQMRPELDMPKQYEVQ